MHTALAIAQRFSQINTAARQTENMLGRLLMEISDDLLPKEDRLKLKEACNLLFQVVDKTGINEARTYIANYLENQEG